jgi:hypothetical protein
MAYKFRGLSFETKRLCTVGNFFFWERPVYRMMEGLEGLPAFGGKTLRGEEAFPVLLFPEEGLPPLSSARVSRR